MTSTSSINLIITINCHLVLIKTGKQSLWPAPVLFTQSSLLLSFKASLFLCRSSFQGRSKVRPFLSAPVSAPSNIQHPTPNTQPLHSSYLLHIFPAPQPTGVRNRGQEGEREPRSSLSEHQTSVFNRSGVNQGRLSAPATIQVCFPTFWGELHRNVTSPAGKLASSGPWMVTEIFTINSTKCVPFYILRAFFLWYFFYAHMSFVCKPSTARTIYYTNQLCRSTPDNRWALSRSAAVFWASGTRSGSPRALSLWQTPCRDTR